MQLMVGILLAIFQVVKTPGFVGLPLLGFSQSGPSKCTLKTARGCVTPWVFGSVRVAWIQRESMTIARRYTTKRIEGGIAFKCEQCEYHVTTLTSRARTATSEGKPRLRSISTPFW